MLTKYASFDSEVLEVKSSPTQRTASLRTLSDFHDYRTDDGYLYVRIRAISSRTNKNHDGWPTAELAGGSEAWEKMSSERTAAEGFTVEASKDSKYGFSTFIGKPIFVDHHNSNPKRARGVIVDSKFNVLDHKTAADSGDEYWSNPDKMDPEHNPPSEVELLLEVDAKSFPKFAKAIVDGDIDGFSMGCDVEYSKCSHCGNRASTPDEYCAHIVSKGAEHDYTSATGERISKRSYENCYGIGFFEISGVFDPADETAKSKEVIAAVRREAEANPYHKPAPEEVMQLARRVMVDNPGMPMHEAMLAAEHELAHSFDGPVQGGDGAAYDLKVKDTMALPPDFPALTERHQGSYLASRKTAQPEEPQSMHVTAPEDVNTLREEKVCPLCGSDMDEVRCEVCGYEEPPDQLQNPDLDQAKAEHEESLEGDPSGSPTEGLEEHPDDRAEAGPLGESYLKTRNQQPTASVTNEMRWAPKGIDHKLAAPRPQGDEPNETVTSDQDTPVTSAFRTAQQLIAAAKRNQEKNNMSDHKVAADPADASGKPDKRVDVTGVGGVIQDSNEQASKPEGAHSWEPKGTTVDVEGKGGVLEDSNAEASKPSDGTVDVEKKSDPQSSGPTKTFDNSNEPGSAVTDKAVQAAKQGVKPIGGKDVQPERREDVEQESGFSNPQKGTDQWTGTGGNGVLKQQDPVTNKASGLVSLAALRLVDAEVELGITAKASKFDRLAELADVDEAEIAAEHRALAKVKTAGLTRTASKGGAGRMPSFNKIARDTTPEPQRVDDDLLDAGLYS